MANEVLFGSSRQTAILRRAQGALGIAATVLTKVRLVGHQRVTGVFRSDVVSATGYPRVRQSVDGTNYDLTTIIARDLTQPNFTYPFDIVIKLPYVSVEFVNGGAAATAFSCHVWASPVFGSGVDVVPGSSSFVTVRSDKDTNFTGAIAQNEHATANIVGLPSNIGQITSVTLMAEENLDWDVVFWTSDDFDNADLDLDDYLEHVSFKAQDAMTIVNGTSTTFRYAATATRIPYRDDDQTNELHVSLVPRNAAKTAGATGEVVLAVTFEPETA